MRKLKLLGVMLLALTFGVVNVKAEEKTLQELINAAEDGATIKLTEDHDGSITINGKNIVLDLDGHKIESTEDVIVVTNESFVIVTGNGTIKSTGDSGISIYSGSSVTLESGNIRTQEFGVYTSGNATFTMNGGSIETVDNCGVGGNGSNGDGYKNYTININGGTIKGNIVTSGYIACGVYHPNKGTVNITGGTITANGGVGVVQRAGILNITGGTITATGEATGWVGDSKNVLTSAAVVVDKSANYPEVATLETRIAEVATLNSDLEEAVATKGDDVVVEIVPKGSDVYQVIGGDNDGKYIVVKEEDLEITTEVDELNKEDIEDEIAGYLEAYEKAKNGEIEYDEEDMEFFEFVKEFKDTVDKYNVIGYYEISALKVTEDNDVVDLPSEISEPVEVKLVLPEELPEVKEGFTRKYYVVRVHNGEVTVIDDVTVNDDGTVSFKSDKFSTYALAYEDVVNETPKEEVKPVDTFDGGIVSYIVMMVAMLGMITYVSLYLKKRFN